MPSFFDLRRFQVLQRRVSSRWVSGGGAAACHMIHPQGVNSFPPHKLVPLLASGVS